MMGMRRKAVWVGWTRCNHGHFETDPLTGADVFVKDCGIVFLDKVLKFPHRPRCPKGHAQACHSMDGKITDVVFESEDSEQFREIVNAGYYSDKARGFAYGRHVDAPYRTRDT